MMMEDGVAKLAQDLSVLAAMAAGMDDYLKSDALFGRMEQEHMPKLTLGGYLMRQYRLLILSDLLSESQQAELETAVTQYNTALIEKVVRFETKAHAEMDARIRQFDAYLRDLRNRQATGINYETAVEPRAMLAALADKLNVAPFRLNRQIPGRIETLDRNLRQHWVPGDFIWPAAWQPAYPPESFWWLYGRPD
jgi:hypothetical protein